MNSTYAINTEPLLLNVRTTDLHVTPAQFDNLCQANPDLPAIPNSKYLPIIHQ